MIFSNPDHAEKGVYSVVRFSVEIEFHIQQRIMHTSRLYDLHMTYIYIYINTHAYRYMSVSIYVTPFTKSDVHPESKCQDVEVKLLPCEAGCICLDLVGLETQIWGLVL